MFINNNLNKGISTPIAILIVMLAAVIGGGLVLWQYSEMEKETANVPETEYTKIDTTNWKTYKIGEFQCGYIGYEIKYPADFIAKGWEEEPIGRCPAATLHSVSFVKIKDSKKIEVFAIITKGDPEQLIYQSYEKENVIPVRINGIDGLKIAKDKFAFSKPEKLYIISTENYSDSDIKKSFNQMLSTFKFIE